MNKKIVKVTFHHEAIQKENIAVDKIPAPVIKGSIELQLNPKKGYPKNPNSNRPIVWDEFPLKDWSWYLSFANDANKKIGIPFCITLSKRDKDGVLESENGTIWYTCGSKQFKDLFKIPLLRELELFGKGLRQLNKSEIKSLSFGTDFKILWQEESGFCELIDVKMLEKSPTKIAYLFDSNDYVLKFDCISESGRGELKYEDGTFENFWFFVDEKLENL